MRRMLVALTLFTSLNVSVARSQTYGWLDWSTNIPESGMGLTDVHSIGNEGWITGGNSKLYHSTDGGQTFTIQNFPAGSGITNSIFMRSATEGYLVTSTGKVFRSTDAGNGNWVAISPGASVALFSVSFPPTDTVGYACGNSGGIYRVTPSRVALDFAVTTSTWTSICLPVAAEQGWVAGGAIRHRTAAGWIDDQFYDAGDLYNAIFFVDNSSGWAVGSSANRGTIIHTMDGIHWSVYQDRTTATGNLNDVFFLTAQEGWTVGYDGSTGIILHTTNGGTTWPVEGQSVTGGRLLRAVFAVDNHTVYVVGNNTFLKYMQVTDVDYERVQPTSFSLEQNYPNPFNPTTTIQYDIPKASLVTLKVYNVLGQEVATLVDEVKQPGEYTVRWDATGQPSGVYFYRMTAGSHSETRKLVLLK